MEGADIDDNDEETEEARTLQEVASFDKVVLWGHESLVEGDDAFMKGLGEWIGFAEAVRPILSRMFAGLKPMKLIEPTDA